MEELSSEQLEWYNKVINEESDRLSFSRKKLGDNGAKAVAAALKVNRTIKKLNLRGNKIGEMGAIALADALKSNATLCESSLDHALHDPRNEIGDSGARAISEALKVNRTVTSLRLSWNKITDAGAKSLLEALETNRVLISLELSRNNISKDLLSKIDRFLKRNKNLPLAHALKQPISNSSPSSSTQQDRVALQSVQTQLNEERQKTIAQEALLEQERQKVSALQTSLNQEREKTASLQNQLDSANRVIQELRNANRVASPASCSASSSSSSSSFSISIPTYSMDLLKAACSNFEAHQVIGEGGFGKVYAGKLFGASVAVKKLSLDSMQGPEEFNAELEVLSRFRHPNIIMLMGTARDNVDCCLVYELMPNGSVRDCLDLVRRQLPLPWNLRQRIALQAAQAMDYLQRGVAGSMFYHLDLKTHNVLLDANFNAKLSDCGLSRAEPIVSDSQNYLQTATPKGTLTHMCPEYMSDGKISSKTDVYSYGMILLELLTAKQARPGLPSEMHSFFEEDNSIVAVLDQAINWGAEDTRQANNLYTLAEACVSTGGRRRPTFAYAIQTLESDAPYVRQPIARNVVTKDCTICMEEPVVSRLMPCRHACACDKCIVLLKNSTKKCPVCRSRFDQTAACNGNVNTFA